MVGILHDPFAESLDSKPNPQKIQFSFDFVTYELLFKHNKEDDIANNTPHSLAVSNDTFIIVNLAPPHPTPTLRS